MKLENKGLKISIEPKFKSLKKWAETKFPLCIKLVGGGRSEKRKAIHNTLLFDVSGSTEEAHVGDLSVLAAMKKAVYKIHKYAIKGDTLTIIPFSSTANVEARAISATDRSAIVAAIDPSIAGGNTNFYDALALGLKEPRPNQILLLTDGKVNEGRVSNIEGICKWLQRQDRKVRVNTIGFGKYSDMNGLREIAETTGGQARFALTSYDLVGALSSMIVPPNYYVASEIEMKFEAEKDVIITSPTKDYDVEGDITTKIVEIDRLYPHEIRNFIFDVEVEPQDEKRVDIGCLYLSYRQNGELIDIKKQISIPVKSKWNETKEENKKVSEFLATVAAAEKWLATSNFNDAFTCVCGTCVNIVQHEEEYDIANPFRFERGGGENRYLGRYLGT